MDRRELIKRAGLSLLAVESASERDGADAMFSIAYSLLAIADAMDDVAQEVRRG